MTPSGLEPHVLAVRDAALARVEDQRGVRVEDYLAVLAAVTGEAAIVASGVVDIEDNELVPGSAVFGDAINEILTGDATELADVPASTVVGVLRDLLVPGVVAAGAFGSLEDRYRHVAATVGEARWGDVTLTVPEDHRPTVLPLQVAFELRPIVIAVEERIGAAMEAGLVTRPEGWARHQLCALALASAVEQTAGALDPRLSLHLALEVVFGMAKVVPMSAAAFDQVGGDG